jgi:hypothetical protein
VVRLGLFASVVPLPLYTTYDRLWHFSTVTLTLVYATYAVGVLLALLLAGGASDQLEPAPVLLGSLAALADSTVLFIVADPMAWLFAA